MCTGAEIAALTAAAGATAGTAATAAAPAAAAAGAGAAATGAGLLSTLPLIEAAAAPAALEAASALAITPEMLAIPGAHELGAGLYAGMGVDKLAAAGGAASELGATSSSLGAAGQAANPYSVMLGNFTTSPLGQGIGRGLDVAGKAQQAGLLGRSGGGGGAAPPARPRAPSEPQVALADIMKRRYGLLGRRPTGARRYG